MAEQPAERTPPALSARAMVEAYGFAPGLAPAAVVVFDAELLPPQRFRRSRRARDPRPFRQIVHLGPELSLVCAAGPGAPTAAVTVEFLAALGVERIVTVGTAGDLHGSLPHGPHPVASAVSDEGTSSHYGTDLTADTELTALLEDATGRPALTTLTTDVPFRHSHARLARHRTGAAVVEMECAAVFAVAHSFDMRAASVLVVADRFRDEYWYRGDPAATRRELRVAVDVATRVAASALS